MINNKISNKYHEDSIQILANLIKSNKLNYWGNEKNESAIFNARLPDKKKLILMADQVVKGYVQFWHPWHMELTHYPEKLVNPKEWFIARNGDQEWLDSLVRFTHMFDLAAAFKITGKRKYIDAFSSYLESFSKARIISHRHWKDQLNTAIRVSNLIKSIDLFDHELVSEQLIKNVIEEILIDCEFLYSNLGEKVGNWEIAITTSLLTVSSYFGQQATTSRWVADADRRLLEILRSDTHDDGIQIEEVPLYHGEVILFLLDYLTVLKVNEIKPTPFLVKIIEKMLLALRDMADPEGMIPPIGDSDRFPVSYVLKLSELLLNSNCDDGTQSVSNACSTDNNSASLSLKVFDKTGWAIMRWKNSDKLRSYLLFDCSGKPYSKRSWHSHADDLSFILHTSEGPLITDPGRFTYAHEFPFYFPYTNRRTFGGGWKSKLSTLFKPSIKDLNSRDWREYFRSTLSHNTVSCDGKNQPFYDDSENPGSSVGLLNSLTMGSLFLLMGELDTTRRGKSWEDLSNLNSLSGATDYRHWRAIYGNTPNFVVVVDRLESAHDRNWVNSIHFSYDCQLVYENNGVNAILGGSSYFVKTFGKSDQSIEYKLQEDWISEIYNLKKSSRTYRATVKNKKNAMFFTVIYQKDLVSKNELDIKISDIDNYIVISIAENKHGKIIRELNAELANKKMLITCKNRKNDALEYSQHRIEMSWE